MWCYNAKGIRPLILYSVVTITMVSTIISLPPNCAIVLLSSTCCNLVPLHYKCKLFYYTLHFFVSSGGGFPSFFCSFVLLFIHLFVYLFIRLFVYLFICLYVYTFICLFVYTFICLYVYLFICLYVYLFICLFVYLFICLYVYSFSYLLCN